MNNDIDFPMPCKPVINICLLFFKQENICLKKFAQYGDI